jgi:hypothetical protein
MVATGRKGHTYNKGWAPSPSHSRDSKKPKKHHADRAVSAKKSAIIDRSAKNIKLSDSRVNASRGITTGAARARTSYACSAGLDSPVRQL